MAPWSPSRGGLTRSVGTACKIHGYSGTLPCPVPGCPRGHPSAIYIATEVGRTTTTYVREEVLCQGDACLTVPHRGVPHKDGSISLYSWEWKRRPGGGLTGGDLRAVFGGSTKAVMIGTRMASAIKLGKAASTASRGASSR